MPEDETPDEKPVRRKRTPPKPADDICPQCWPDGWPADAYSAVCDHGTYKR